MKKIILPVLVLSLSFASAQNKNAYGEPVKKSFTKQDTLFGSNTKFRDFWDVKKYDIEVEPDFATKSLSGNNRIGFEFTKDISDPTFQIDIQQPMKIVNLLSDFEIIDQHRDGNFLFIKTKGSFSKGDRYFLSLDFEGNPIIAKRPPWDGGWIFVTDPQGNPWMTSATEGIGESVWLPMKDYWGDEPDEGMTMRITAPSNLVSVSNGRLIDTEKRGNKTISTWEVKNPINGYSITPYVGDYGHFSDVFDGEKGTLTLDYYVLKENLDKAKAQFQIVKPMLKAFEYWFGPYPFYEDGYKLVETPHLGMEHQSAVAYGNGFANGYLGRDLSHSGVGLKWDFIIVHESGHEWFANNITAEDPADMWVQESFTNYSETLFTEYVFGKEDAEKYVIGTRQNVENDIPIIGHYGVRDEGSGDVYYKGGNMIHTIRQVIDNDEKFRDILRGLNKDFYHQIVTGKQVQDYMIQKSGIDLSSIFTQYLTTTKIPTLEYKQDGKKLSFRWTNTVPNFQMPLRLKSEQLTINPTEAWQTVKLKNKKTPVQFDVNYYVDYKSVK